MLHSPRMFGMGIGEILIILVVALLVVGPDKLPSAARSISKGLRDLRKQTREIQETLEEDTDIGSAIRDLKSALRGDEFHEPPRKRPGPGAAPALDQVGSQAGHAGAIAAAGSTAPGTAAPDTTAPDGTPGGTPGGIGAAPAEAPGPDRDTSAGDEGGEAPLPSPAFPEPVIRTPKAAVARGIGASASGDEPSAPAGTAGADAAADTPANDIAEKKAHG